MATARVGQHGKVTIPKEIRAAIGIETGNLIDCRVVGPHQVVCDVLRVKPLEYFWETFQSDEPYDDAAVRDAWQEDAALAVTEP